MPPAESPSQPAPSVSGPVCTRCAHYFVTFDARFPHGCRAMGFKSRQLPYKEILAVAGEACAAFTPKPARRRPPG